MWRWWFCLYHVGTERLLVTPISVFQKLIHTAEYHAPQVVMIGKLNPAFFQQCQCIPITKSYKMNVVCTLFTGELCTHHLSWQRNEIHKYKTRNNNNLHLPKANLSKLNKGAYTSGIIVFNNLPQYIKALTNDQKYFKSKLKRFLYHHYFYPMNTMNIRRTEEYEP